MRNPNDMIGRRFGTLLAEELADPTYRGNGKPMRRYMCRCDCGNTKVVIGQNLTSGSTRSCGCRGGKFKHGHNRAHAASKTYNTWVAMRHRCMNPKNSAYSRYGGKGITVCPEWADGETGFEAFLADMGERPENCTLDRIDNKKGYSKTNCRWATTGEQYANKRVVRDSTGKFTT